jgi:hypothetical protein
MTRQLLILFLLSLLGASQSFTLPTSNRCVSLGSSSLHSVPDKKTSEETQNSHDDAFGLIFLSALIAENDYPFATAFVLISGASAILTKQKVLPYRPLLPGVVAVVAYALAAAIDGRLLPPLEGAVCAVSVVWSLVQEVQLQKEGGED